VIVFYCIILYNLKAVNLTINPVEFILTLIEFLANNEQFTMSVQNLEIWQLCPLFKER